MPNRKGHLSVGLSEKGKTKTQFVHRLVLLAFTGPCPEGFQGCHNDGDPSNNHVENLRWDSQSGNVLDTVRHGTHRQTKKQVCTQGHPLQEPNLVQSHVRRGFRSCLACNRARRRIADLRSRGKESSMPFQELADAYHAEITQGVPRPTVVQTHCPQGHAYTPENTRIRHRMLRGKPNTSRVCRTCEAGKKRAA